MEKTFFARGKRSNVYLVTSNKKKYILKEELTKNKTGQIKNEIYWLKKLNKYKIGPKLKEEHDTYFICEYIKGKRIIEFLEKSNSKEIKKVLKEVLNQCFILDKLKVDKKEMTNPYKHIIMDKKPVMIDFERCKLTNKPSNVTQFLQFITSKKIEDILKKKDINIDKDKIITLSRNYKKTYSKKEFERILKLIS